MVCSINPKRQCRGGAVFTRTSTANGRIDVIWYDGRTFLDGSSVDVFYAKSLDQGQTFSNVPITNPNLKINDFSVSTEATAGFLGHYIGIASATDSAHPIWTGKVDPNDPRDMVYDRITFPSHGGGGGGGSVLAGSLITMADGTKVPVQNLVSGDRVQGYNTASGEIVIVEVSGLREVVVDNLVVIRLSDGTTLRTDNNPLQKFWVKTSDGTTGMIGVPDIQIGDSLFNVPLRAWVPVVGKEYISHGQFTMYDIITSAPDLGYIVEDILDPGGCPKACPV